MKCYRCSNKYTGEVVILPEVNAFDLDNRQWVVKEWNCTSGAEKPVPTTAPAILKYEANIASRKCKTCGSYIRHDSANCIRKQHVAFA